MAHNRHLSISRIAHRLLDCLRQVETLNPLALDVNTGNTYNIRVASLPRELLPSSTLYTEQICEHL